MISNWTLSSFGNAPLEIIDGDRGKNYPAQADFRSDGYCLFLNAGNVTSQGFDFSDCSFISREKDASLRKGKLLRGDVVLTTRGTVGNVAYFDHKVPFDNLRINSGMVILRANPRYLDPRYLYLFLRSALFARQVAALRTGTAQPQLPIRDINRISIVIPPLAEQRAIAHILGSLDDKIELNRQMNRTLEEMARAIFKSWFVDFDPVYAKARGEQPVGMDTATAALFPDSFDETELGPVPRGWKTRNLKDVAGINMRSVSKDYPHDVIEYIDISSVTVGSLSGTTSYALSDAPSRARRLVQHGDTIWSTVRPNRRSYLFIHTLADNLVVSTGFAVLSPKLIPPAFLYQWVTTDEFVDYLTLNADGSAYPAVNADRFAEALLVLPDAPVLASFHELVAPMYDMIHSNSLQSHTLAELRDTLLPKLMSGELRVPEAAEMAQTVEMA